MWATHKYVYNQTHEHACKYDLAQGQYFWFFINVILSYKIKYQTQTQATHYRVFYKP